MTWRKLIKPIMLQSEVYKAITLCKCLNAPKSIFIQFYSQNSYCVKVSKHLDKYLSRSLINPSEWYKIFKVIQSSLFRLPTLFMYKPHINNGMIARFLRDSQNELDESRLITWRKKTSSLATRLTVGQVIIRSAIEWYIRQALAEHD